MLRERRRRHTHTLAFGFRLFLSGCLLAGGDRSGFTVSPSAHMLLTLDIGNFTGISQTAV